MFSFSQRSGYFDYSSQHLEAAWGYYSDSQLEAVLRLSPPPGPPTSVGHLGMSEKTLVITTGVGVLLASN